MNQHEIDQRAFEDIFGYRKDQKLTEHDVLLRVARMDAWHEALKYERQKLSPTDFTPVLNIKDNLLKYRTQLLTMSDRLVNDMNVLYGLTQKDLQGAPKTGIEAREQSIVNNVNLKIMNHPGNQIK